MQRISNNVTLFLKLFVPTFWFVFFTSFLVAVFVVDADSMPLLGSTPFRIAFTSIYILFALFLYLTVMKLMRVDMTPEKVFVGNYMKTYSYNYEDIERIQEANFYLFRIITIHLRSKGTFGKKIRFIPSYRNYLHFIGENQELFTHLIDK